MLFQIGKLCIDLIAQHIQIVFFNYLCNGLQILPLHHGTGWIVRERKHQKLGLRRNCGLQFLRCQSKLILRLQFNNDRHAVGQHRTRYIGYIAGLRNQHLVTGVQHGTHGNINRLTATDGN